MKPPAPTRSSDELEEARLEAIERFRSERLDEPLEEYLEAFDHYRGVIEELLEASVDLEQLSEEIVEDANLLEALRYLAGPPISSDDLKVVADTSLAPSRLHADPQAARDVIDTILIALDRRRFPWVQEQREPDAGEREAATMASAALMASSRVATSRRQLGKASQEAAVATALIDAGFDQVATRTITTAAEAPGAGEFCGESLYGNRKADFVIGTYDGRTMALECKVSNSSVNSIKRLNNDAAVKAPDWLRTFGTAQAIPAAMLSGVFNRAHLEYAQEQGLAIFWAHRLHELVSWLEATKTNG